MWKKITAQIYLDSTHQIIEKLKEETGSDLKGNVCKNKWFSNKGKNVFLL